MKLGLMLHKVPDVTYVCVCQFTCVIQIIILVIINWRFYPLALDGMLHLHLEFI